MKLCNFLLFLTTILAADSASLPECGSAFDVIRDPKNCSVFYQCAMGKPQQKICPNTTVYSLRAKVCVWPESATDDCPTAPPLPQASQSLALLDLNATCSTDPRAVFEDPFECQLFYNCSQLRHGSVYFRDYMDECHYPQLFDARSLKCDDYSNVECGTREEYVNACNYRRTWCTEDDSCESCWADNPRCEGLSDGLHVHPGRDDPSWYITCKDQRFVNASQCEDGKVFSGRDSRCVDTQ